MLKNYAIDYDMASQSLANCQDELETVDTYVQETHFEDSMFKRETVNELDIIPIEKMLRQSNMELTNDVLDTIEKKLTLNEFSEDDVLSNEELIEVFGSPEQEEMKNLEGSDISLAELHTIFRKAA